MSVIVGSLQIDVTTGTATFTLDDAKTKLDQFGAAAKDASDKLDYSMRGARESIMLTGDALGFHLPAGITRVIASIGPLGPALEAALPAAAVAAGVVLLVSHYEKLAEAIRKAAAEAVNSSIKYADEGRSLEVVGLKLDDQIATLEGRPTTNKLAEAIRESANELDKLASSFASEDQKMSDGLSKELSLWSRVSDYILAVAKDSLLMAGGEGGSAATVEAAKWHEAEQSVVQAVTGVQEARLALAQAPAGSDAEKSGVEALIHALEAQRVAESNLAGAAEEGSAQRQNALNDETRTTSELKQLRQQEANSAKAEIVARLEDGKARLQHLQAEANVQKVVTQGVLAHEAAVHKLVQTETETATAGVERDSGKTIGEKLDAKLKAIDTERVAAMLQAEQILDAKKIGYESELRVAGNNAEKKKEIEAEYTNAVAARNDALAQAAAQSEGKITAATAAAAAERLKISQEEARAALANAISDDQKKIESIRDTAKYQEDAVKASAARGIIDKIQAGKELLTILQQEQADQKAVYATELADLQKHAADMRAAALAASGTSDEGPAQQAATQAMNQYTAAAKQAEKAQNDLDIKITDTTTSIALLSASWKIYFDRMSAETMDFGSQLREQTQKDMDKFGGGMLDNIVALTQGAKTSFKSLLMSVSADIEKFLLSQVIKQFLGMFMQSNFAGGLAGGSLFGGGGLFGGGHAEGGGVDAGTTYLVGERGPELFTAGTSGYISPNSSLGGSNVNVHYNIDARGADAGAEQRIRAAMRETEDRAVARAIASSNEMAKRRSS